MAEHPVGCLAVDSLGNLPYDLIILMLSRYVKWL